jgi:DNA-binding response OmpR family regulator
MMASAAAQGTGPMRVLVVEDESTIARPLKRALEREGYAVSLCETGHSALRLERTWEPDVILLDLLLPDMDGRDVAREVRTRSQVPIIMVTARGEEADRVAGLELGADDYVVKPFSVPELIARMRAVARRTQTPHMDGDSVLTFKNLRLDLGAYRAYKGDAEMGLTNKEFELLRMLMMKPGALVRREEVVRAIWNMSLSESGKTLDVHVSGLRKKLGDEARHPTYIETVRSVGFRLASA